PRWKEISVQHLLDHRGGWDPGKVPDPMYSALEIAAALGKPGPATARDIITYMAGQPLQFKPGQKRAGFHLGHCVPGRAIGKGTGLGSLDFLRQEVLDPLGLRTVGPARSLPGDRSPREPYYADPAFGRNVMHPDSRVPVAAPDGSFCLEAMDAAAGLIGSAADVARLLPAHPIAARPRPPQPATPTD